MYSISGVGYHNIRPYYGTQDFRQRQEAAIDNSILLAQNCIPAQIESGILFGCNLFIE
jgi:hypothetical protein